MGVRTEPSAVSSANVRCREPISMAGIESLPGSEAGEEGPLPVSLARVRFREAAAMAGNGGFC
jgi:hypothetical protein